jgi:hypothetical protein
MIDSVIGVLNLAKAALLLVPIDLYDHLDKYRLEGEITGLSIAFQSVETPLAIAGSYMKRWADCPPVATLAQSYLAFQEEFLKPLKDRRAEVEAKINALEIEQLKSESLQRTIDLLTDFKDAVTLCKEL